MAHDWLTGAIDLHIHNGPDSMPRWGDAIDIARAGAAAGMRAILFKDHLVPSIIKAKMAEKVVSGIQLFGGVCLNSTVGGLNPRIVAWAIVVGAKQVMLPTVDSKFMVARHSGSLHFREFTFGEEIKPVAAFENERPLPALDKVLRQVAENNLVLSTGHLGPDECIPTIYRAKELGVKHIVVEHPNFYYHDGWELQQIKDAADAGAYINISFGANHPYYGRHDPRESAEIIHGVGAERCNMITDFGQAESPAPPEGMRMFCEILLRCGVTTEEIELMTKRNPAKILDLDD